MSTPKIPVSVVFITLNEGSGIAKALDAVKLFEQIVVVDSNSNDNTQEISRSMGAELVSFTWNGRYPKKKQWSLELNSLRHDWVLLLDGDEAPSPALVHEIEELVETGGLASNAAYDISLDYRFAGRILKHGHRVTKRSLLNRHLCAFPDVGDHELPGIREVEGHYQPAVEGSIGRMEGVILHDDVDPIATWFARHNNYSDWEAHLTYRGLRGKTDANRNSQGRLFQRVPFKPLAFFVYSYVIKQGFRDRRAGLDFAIGLAFYYWQIGVKHRELKRGL